MFVCLYDPQTLIYVVIKVALWFFYLNKMLVKENNGVFCMFVCFYLFRLNWITFKLILPATRDYENDLFYRFKNWHFITFRRTINLDMTMHGVNNLYEEIINRKLPIPFVIINTFEFWRISTTISKTPNSFMCFSV